MRKELADCMEITLLISKKLKRQKRIDQDKEYLKECELRIDQVEDFNKNQIEFKDVRFRR